MLRVPKHRSRHILNITIIPHTSNADIKTTHYFVALIRRTSNEIRDLRRTSVYKITHNVQYNNFIALQ